MPLPYLSFTFQMTGNRDRYETLVMTTAPTPPNAHGFEYVSPSIFVVPGKRGRCLALHFSDPTLHGMGSSAISQGPKFKSSSTTSGPRSTDTSEPSTPGPVRDSYFGNAIYESPPASDSCDSESSYDDDDAHTDSTLDDVGIHPDFGHPLQRMPRVRSADHGLNYDSDAELKALLRTASSSQSSVSIPDSGLANYNRIIDMLLDQKPNPFISHEQHNMVIFDSPLDDTMYRYQEALPPLMVKRFKKSASSELLLLELNVPELREDPWNASPHIVHALERDGFIYLCLQRLFEYNNPPLASVAHYIDFFRQVLEGLSFLHEQRIAGFRCSEPSSFMVDLSSMPHTPAPLRPGGTEAKPQFDRFTFPVKYYFVDFSEARHIAKSSPYSSSSSTPDAGIGSDKRADNPFKRDIQDCGALFDKLLNDVPPIASKFKSLTKAMIFGGFSADDARRLFEALCRSLDASVFEKLAISQGSNKPRAHTICHLEVDASANKDFKQKVVSR